MRPLALLLCLACTHAHADEIVVPPSAAPFVRVVETVETVSPAPVVAPAPPANLALPPIAPAPIGACLAAGCLPEQHPHAPATNTKQWWQMGIEIAMGALVTLDFTLRQTGH